MALNKEQLLTLTCLKEVGVKGIGPKKIFSIAATIESKNISINSYEELACLMNSMSEKAIHNVRLEDLQNASQYAKRIIGASSEKQIGYVGYYDDDYPSILRETINEEGKVDPPLILWYRGDLSITKLPGLAIIGTREATPEGISGGEFLSGQFAMRGFNIVSGLAIGCDTSAHKGALKVSGKTTAILANSLDYESIYPPENQALAEKIIESGGLLLSEYHYKTTVNKYNLVDRDRLQAGLSLATIVIQTGIKGGTMHAANITLQAGKPLFSMLFKDESTNQQEKCLGNALLVKQGAKYIKGKDNFDEISEYIKNRGLFKRTLF